MVDNMFVKKNFFVLVISVAFVGILFLSWKIDQNSSAKLSDVGAYVSDTTNGITQFRSDIFGFKLDYPSVLMVNVYNEDNDAYTLTFESVDNEKKGFQIFITPYDGATITSEQILKDLPGTEIQDPVEVILGDGTRALIFWSNNETIGKTREVWFVYDGHLYEITTYVYLDSWLAEILNTWEFDK